MLDSLPMVPQRGQTATSNTAIHNTNLTASDQLLFVYTCLPNATLILFELLTTAPVNALYYIENFQGHKTENAFI